MVRLADSKVDDRQLMRMGQWSLSPGDDSADQCRSADNREEHRDKSIADSLLKEIRVGEPSFNRHTSRFSINSSTYLP